MPAISSCNPSTVSHFLHFSQFYLLALFCLHRPSSFGVSSTLFFEATPPFLVLDNFILLYTYYLPLVYGIHEPLLTTGLTASLYVLTCNVHIDGYNLSCCIDLSSCSIIVSHTYPTPSSSHSWTNGSYLKTCPNLISAICTR